MSQACSVSNKKRERRTIHEAENGTEKKAEGEEK